MELLIRAQPDFFGLSILTASGFPHHVDSICCQRAVALGWANAPSMQFHVLNDFPFSKSAEGSTTKSIWKPRKVPQSHGSNALSSTHWPRIYNIRGIKGSSHAIDIFADFSRDSSHQGGRLLGLLGKSLSRRISNGVLMKSPLLSRLSSLANILGISFYHISSTSAFIRFYQH